MSQAIAARHIRWIIRRDLPAVLAIEATLDGPWEEGHLLKLLRARNVIGMVVDGPDGEPIGYMIYSLHKARIHVERIAVAGGHRGAGVFRSMVRKLHGKLSAMRRTSVTAIVDERNLDLLLAMRACGFLAFELIPGHFDDADGIHLSLPLDAAP